MGKRSNTLHATGVCWQQYYTCVRYQIIGAMGHNLLDSIIEDKGGLGGILWSSTIQYCPYTILG